MADYYTHHTASQSIPATREDYERLQLLIDEPSESGEEGCHGFEMEFSEEGVYLFAEQNGTVGELPTGFLDAFGALIGAAGLPFLEIGWADTASRMCPASCGGGGWRLYPDGTVVFQEHYWPEREDNEVEAAMRHLASVLEYTKVSAHERVAIASKVGLL